MDEGAQRRARCPRRASRRRTRTASILACALLACGLAMLLTACAGFQDEPSSNTYGTKVSGTLTVASDLSSPPMSFVDEKTGEQRGFEYDVVCEVADRLGLKVSYAETVPFAELAEQLQEGEADLGASSFTATEANEINGLIMSDSYLESGRALVTSKDAERTTPEELNVEGVTVVVQAESASEAWARSELPNATIVYADDATEALTKVSNGTCTCAVCDTVTANYLINNVYSQLQVSYEEPDVSGFVFVATQDKSDLIDAVNAALSAMRQDGTMASLQVKWFGSQVS